MLKNLINIISFATNLIVTALISVMFPIVDVLTDVAHVLSNEILGIDFKIVKKIYRYSKNILKTNYWSLMIYYIFLLIPEIYLLLKILQGEIECFSFIRLLSYTLTTIFFNIIFVIFLNRYYKLNKFSYIIYFQILFLFPLVLVYWIACIEGNSLYLKKLNSDQWISLFNTIIIYFSGCLIGLVTLYKMEEDSHVETRKK